MRKIKSLSLLVFAAICFLNASAQRTVMLHSTGNVKTFTGAKPLIDAYAAAANGDTIYLPGGQFEWPANYSKSLHIYGIGFHPDSISSLGNTYISNSVFLYAGSDKSSFEGLRIPSIGFYKNIDSLNVTKCYIGSVSFSYSDTFLCGDLLFRDNVFYGNFYANKKTNRLVLRNNIFKKVDYQLLTGISNNAWIANNIIMGRGYVSNWTGRFVISDIQNTLFENNCIMDMGGGVYTFANVSNCTFRNNSFVNDPTSDLFNTWVNNYVNIVTTDLFVNVSNNTTFDFSEDFHLKNPSSFLGTTNNQIGIYGGYFPLNHGWIPRIPFIRTHEIDIETDAQGNIEVDIQVEAQTY